MNQKTTPSQPAGAAAEKKQSRADRIFSRYFFPATLCVSIGIAAYQTGRWQTKKMDRVMETAIDYIAIKRDNAALIRAAQEVFGRIPVEKEVELDSAMITFVWMKKNIEYVKGAIPRRTPEEVYKERKGDCDEQAMFFAGVMEVASKRSTRIIHLNENTTGHSFAQIRCGDAGELDSVVAKVKAALIRQYGLDEKKAGTLSKMGWDDDSNGVWFTFDTTGKYPGERACVPRNRECMPREILYSKE